VKWCCCAALIEYVSGDVFYRALPTPLRSPTIRSGQSGSFAPPKMSRIVTIVTIALAPSEWIVKVFQPKFESHRFSVAFYFV
jgi:hypothetical protein